MKNKLYKVSLFMIDSNDTEYPNNVNIARLQRCGLVKMKDVLYLVHLKKEKEIIVYKSFGKFREIITGMEIPALRMHSDYETFRLSLTKTEPLIFKYYSNRTVYNDEQKLESLIATPKQIEKYFEENLSIKEDIYQNYANVKELYRKELEELFQQAWDSYDKFVNDNDINVKEDKKANKQKTKQLMKKYDLK